MHALFTLVTTNTFQINLRCPLYQQAISNHNNNITNFQIKLEISYLSILNSIYVTEFVEINVTYN